MDPNEVLRLFRQALAEHRWRDAAEAASLIDGWMTAGGFAPESWRKVDAWLMSGSACIECGHVIPLGAMVHAAHDESCSLHPGAMVGGS